MLRTGMARAISRINLSEPAAETRPGHINLMDATPITPSPGYTGDDERLVLEEVHVPPFRIDGVMDLAATSMARWAWEGRVLLEVDMELEFAIGCLEVGTGDLPRRDEAEGGGEQRVGVHADTLGRYLDLTGNYPLISEQSLMLDF